jgi:hypothetical protein
VNTTEERRGRITSIRQFPGNLKQALHGMTDAQLDTPYREGGWTVRQVVHHLADSHMHAYLRMKRIVSEDRPTLKPYDQDVWASMREARSMPVEASVTLLEGLHERWATFLENLPDNAWSRTAQHPERGTVVLDSMVTTYADHGKKHIGHILGLRAAKGW